MSKAKELPFHAEELFGIHSHLHIVLGLGLLQSCARELQVGVKDGYRRSRPARFRSLGLRLEEVTSELSRICEAIGKEVNLDRDAEEWNNWVDRIHEDLSEAIGDDDETHGYKSYTQEELQKVMIAYYDRQYETEHRHLAPDCTMRQIQAVILKTMDGPEGDQIFYYKEGRLHQVDPDVVDARLEMSEEKDNPLKGFNIFEVKGYPLLTVDTHEPVTEIKEEIVVLAPCIGGYLKGPLSKSEEGKWTVEKGNVLAFVAWCGTQKCWVSTGMANLEGIKRLTTTL